MTIKIKRTLTIELDVNENIDKQIIQLVSYSKKIAENSKNINEIIIIYNQLRLEYNMISSIKLFFNTKLIDRFYIDYISNQNENIENFIDNFITNRNFENFILLIKKYYCLVEMQQQPV
jgi:hypothetical protein